MEEFAEVQSVWGPNPLCERGYAFAINSNADGTKIAYGSGKNVVLRDSEDVTNCSVVSSHRAPVVSVKFSNTGSQVLSGDVNGQISLFNVKGNLLEHVKSNVGIGGRIYDMVWYENDKGMAVVGDAQGKNGRVFTVSGTDQGSISGSKRLTSVDMKFLDENKKDIKKAVLVTAGDDLRVKFFKYAGGFSITEEGFATVKMKQNLNMIRFSQDAKFLAVVGGKQILLLSAEDGFKTISEATGDKKKGEHTGNIYAVSWNSSGSHFVTASADRSANLWSVDGGNMKMEGTVSMNGKSQFGPSQSDFQVGVCYIGDGAKDKWAVLSLSGDLNIVVREGSELKLEQTVIAATSDITSLDVCRENGTLAVSTTQGEVLLFDKTGSAQRIKGLKDPKKAVGVVNFEDSVFSCGWDNTVRNCEAKEMKMSTRALPLGGQPVYMRRAAESSKFLCVASRSEVLVLDKSKPNAAYAKLATGTKEVTACALNKDATLLVVGFADKTVGLFNVTAGSVSDAGVKTEALPFGISSLAFSNDGQHFAIGLKSKYVMLCNLKCVKVSDAWSKHSGAVVDVDFSPDGKYLLSAGSEGDLGIWDLSQPESFIPKKYFKKAHLTGVSSAKWLDSTSFYSCGAFDGSIKRWTVAL